MSSVDYMIDGPMVLDDEVIGADARAQLDGLASDINRVFYDAGIRARSKIVNGALVYQMMVPTPKANLLITARVMLPAESWETVEVGAGKIAKKLKKVGKKIATAAKKVANSKVVKKLAKVVGPIAAVVPGLQPVAAGIAVATAAKKVATAAKKGNPKAKKLLGAVAKGARVQLAANAKSSITSTAAPLTARVQTRRYRVRSPEGQTTLVAV